MSLNTKIQWCDSTVNPTMGCDGCEIWGAQRKTCYAGTLHVRFGGVTPGYAPKFEEVALFPGRMREAARWSNMAGKPRPDKPWLDGLPRVIFVSDMSDSLSAAVPFEFLRDEIVENVTSLEGLRHRWLWLTKRPERMAGFSSWLTDLGIEWPDNLWAGTSITTQATTSRINGLLRVGTARTTRFLSVEPQVEPIDVRRWLPKLGWVIQGGESGRSARPFDVAWAMDLIGQCRSDGVPYFLKQLGSVVAQHGHRLPFADGHAGDWSEWPEEIHVREMPMALPHEPPTVQVRQADGKKSAAELSEIAKRAWATRRANEVKSLHVEAPSGSAESREENLKGTGATLPTRHRRAGRRTGADRSGD